MMMELAIFDDEEDVPSPLHDALRKEPTCNIIELRRLLRSGVNPKNKDAQGDTPLHTAAWCEHCTVQVMRELLSFCPSLIHEEDDCGQIALHLALMEARDPEVIQLLLDFGSNPSARTDEGDSPLHSAALGVCSPAIFRQLLDRNVDVNAMNEINATPLHLALSHKCHPDVIKLLLQAGANPDACDNMWRTPLHSASKSQYGGDVFQALLEKSKHFDAVNAFNNTPLIDAIKNGCDYLVVRAFVMKGASVEARAARGYYSLMIGVKTGDVNIVQELLRAKGAAQLMLVYSTRERSTPLQMAASRNLRLARVMIKYAMLLGINITNADLPYKRVDHLASCRRITCEALRDIKEIQLSTEIKLVDVVQDVFMRPYWFKSHPRWPTVDYNLVTKFFQCHLSTLYHDEVNEVVRQLIVDRIYKIRIGLCSEPLFLNYDCSCKIYHFLPQKDKFNLVLAADPSLEVLISKNWLSALFDLPK